MTTRLLSLGLVYLVSSACSGEERPGVLTGDLPPTTESPSDDGAGLEDSLDAEGSGGATETSTGGESSVGGGTSSGGNDSTGGTNSTGGESSMGGMAATGGASAWEPPVFEGYSTPADPDPSLPLGEDLDILIIGDVGVGPATLASDLDAALTESAQFANVRVESVETGHSTGESWQGLMSFFWGWTDRSTRLSLLDDDYDYVVLLDGIEVGAIAPQAHFASVLALADHVRGYGATPVLVDTSSARPLPDQDENLCSDHCFWANDGRCQDGNLGESPVVPGCGYGSDCTDCGVRKESERDPRHAPLEELFWRTAIGTGSIAVPAGAVMGELEIPWTDRRSMFTAAIYSAITSESITNWSGWSVAEPWVSRAERTHEYLLEQETVVHYDAPRLGDVRIEPVEIGDAYRFLTSGTSSENLYGDQMNALLGREGFTPQEIPVGFCATSKVLNQECADRAAAQMKIAPSLSLLARAYSVPIDYLHTEGEDLLLQPQVYDRHTDSLSMDGGEALDTLFSRVRNIAINAHYWGVAWLPQHINFAKYKAATGGNFKKDSAHASDEMSAGLAAMSYVSRTGMRPNVDGLPNGFAVAITLGEHTVRTLSTYSRTGVFIPDVPENRPSFR